MSRALLPSDPVAKPDYELASFAPKELFDLSVIELAVNGEEFHLSVAERTFADAVMAGKTKSDAFRLAYPKQANGKTPAYIASLVGKYCKSQSLQTYFKWLHAQVALRTAATAEELIEKERVVYLQSIGSLKQRKSVIKKDAEGNMVAHHLDVYDPNLSAANNAVETIRKIAGLGVEKHEHRHIKAVEDLTDEEAVEEFMELARKAGLPIGNGLPVLEGEVCLEPAQET